MQTEYEFELPRGYLDSAGEIHKCGKMRLATAADEIGAAKDPRVLNNPSYLTVVILGNVVSEMEGLTMVSASVIEKLFTSDLAFLQDMYQRINDIEPPTMTVICPECGHRHDWSLNFTREG